MAATRLQMTALVPVAYCSQARQAPWRAAVETLNTLRQWRAVHRVRECSGV
ncbi:MAG: hypothetical protein OXM03_12775 [Chloroflexota bacterium]|nr:hypothetical protein [Chloroflexota bacterium]MDE2841494.1 hypothetical protein [Chloroflexota bacterium]